MFGVNLAGDYSLAVGDAAYLTAGPFDFSGYTGTELHFQRWLNTDFQPFVYATIDISPDGTNWNAIWNNGSSEIADDAWVSLSYGISAYADNRAMVFVRWGYDVASPLAFPYSGWNIDDIEFVANPTHALALSLPQTGREGDAPLLGTVTVSPVLAGDLLVTLTSSDTSSAIVPDSVTIPAGQSSATFPITIVDDALLNGTRIVTVKASAPRCKSSSSDLQVFDNGLIVTVPAQVWKNAGVLAGAGSVSISAPLLTNIEIALSSSDPGALAVPAAVTILAGQTAGTFDLMPFENQLQDGNRLVTITAIAPGSRNGTGTVEVLDDNTPPAPSGPFPVNGQTDVSQTTGLAWQSGFLPNDVITNEVYFGTNPTPGPAELQGTTTNNSWTLPLLASQTTYYWQVVSHHVGTTPGPVWQFSTRGLDQIPPLILVQPTNQAVFVGETATFSAVAEGSVPLSYQWSLNGTNLLEGTDAFLVLTNAQLSDAGTYSVLVTNGVGSVLSSNAVLTVSVPVVAPTIVEQPTNQTVTLGGTASFSVVAEGTAPLSYQWRLNGTNLVGATDALMVLANVQLSDAGSYAALVTNSVGSNLSSNALLTVQLPPIAPTIAVQPTNQTVPLGSNASFAVVAEGTEPLNYQWSLNGTNLVNGTNALLALTNVQLSDAGSYAVLVANAVGSDLSSNALLTVQLPSVAPTIVVQPTNRTMSVGGTVSFSVVADGSAPLSYQWRLNGTNLLRATSALLVLANVQHGDAGTYTVLVTNAVGSKLSSNARLKVQASAIAPTIVVQPTNQTVTLGGMASLSGVADGSAPLRYQWRLNGTNLLAATNALLVLTNVQLSDAGSYALRVANGTGSTLSSNALLTVQVPVVAPTITAQPANRTVPLGGMASFGVAAEGSAPLSYQWSLNGVNLLTATNALLVLTNVQLSDAGSYAVLVTNAAGSVRSSNALLTVQLPVVAPTIVVQPTNQAVVVGGTANFGIVADGTEPLSYQWSLNGATLLDATNALLVLTNAQLADSGSYAVLVTNVVGFALSSNALLTVQLPAVAPTIVVQPTNQAVLVGGAVSLEVVAEGTEPLSYEWSLNGATLLDATNALLLLTNVQLADGGSYAVLVTNAVGFALSSNALLTVQLPAVAPTIVVQPTNQTVFVGGTISLEVVAGGTESLSYQWSLNGASLLDATNALLVLTNVQLADGGSYAVLVTNAVGSALSSNALLTVQMPAVAPTIEVQPTNQTVLVGGTISFEVVAEGSEPLSYQWSLNGIALLDATNALLVLTNVQLADGGGYAVLVTNAVGFALSSNALLTVQMPGVAPTIVVQPTNQTVLAGGTISLEVVAGGTEPLSYQWSLNGATLLDATNALLLLTNVQMGDAGGYAVLVTNTVGSALSSNALLTVQMPAVAPTIEVQPTNQTVLAGGTISLEVVAAGTEPLSYQWSLNGANLLDATNALLLLTNVQMGDAGSYAVLVTNDVGFELSSNAVLTVSVPMVAPTIVIQPTNQAVFVGGTVSLEVVADGTEPLSYQWSLNGATLLDATNALLVLTNVQLADGGSYEVLVTNTVGSALSSNALLTVQLPAVAPTIVVQPTNQTVLVGGTISLEVVAEGTEPLSYQWSVNGATLLDATNALLLLTNVQLGDAGTYAVLVTNTVGSELSSNALLTVQMHEGAPMIVVQPTNQTVLVAETVSFEVVAEGSEPLSYQWSLNGATLLDATNSLLLLTNVQLADGGSYVVLVTNTVGFALSSNALLTVQLPAVAPTIVVQPTNQTVLVGGTISLEVVAEGTELLSYQWSLNGANLLYATNALLLLTNMQLGDAGTYAVLVTNTVGFALSSNALLTVQLPPVAPTIVVQPTNQTVLAGGTISLEVVAAGTEPLSYQWSLNGANLTDATNALLVLTNVQLGDAGSYAVLVTNAFGFELSSIALLLVYAPDHFVWNSISSPQVVDVPFVVTIQAQDASNRPETNFHSTVTLGSTNGVSVSPTVSGNFVQGLWTGSVVASGVASNTVLFAEDGFGHFGFSNPINIIAEPQLTLEQLGNTIVISWPVVASGFVLESSTNLSSAVWVPMPLPQNAFEGNYQVRLLISGTKAFYRLRSQSP